MWGIKPKPAETGQARTTPIPSAPEIHPNPDGSRDTWQGVYPLVVKRLEKDLPNLLNFYAFPQHLWKKLRTPNAIERCFVEVRRRTRPTVVFTNVHSVDRTIFHRMNEDWQNRTLELFTQKA